MPNTLQGVIDYARSHPTRDGRTWASWCASFCYRAGGFNQSFDPAMAAGDASGWLNPTYWAAPPGAIHYWAGVGGDGHCAFELGGNTLLMASVAVDDAWGDAMGTVSFLRYARLGIPYRGWSLRWGNETLAGVDDEDIFPDLPQELEQRISNDTIETVQAVRNIQLSLNNLSRRLGPISDQWNFDWLPAISGNVGSLLEILRTLSRSQGVELDNLDLYALSNQVVTRLQNGVMESIKEAVAAALPGSGQVSKQDVVSLIQQAALSLNT